MNARWVSVLPAFLRKRLSGRENFQRIVENTGWLFTDRILRLTIGLFVGVWIARYLGPQRYGLLNYAAALASLFGALATLGLDAVVVRDLVQTPEKRQEILGSAFVMRLGGSLAALTLAGCAALLLRGASDEALLLVLISATGFLFQAFVCIELWFQATMQTKYSILAKTTVFLLVSAVKVALIVLNAPLVAFAWAGLAETAAGSLALIIAYRARGGGLSQWRARLQTMTRLAREGLPLALSGLLVMIYMRIDQIMLGQMLDDRAVGVYAAATRLAEITYIAPTVIVAAIAPALVQTRQIGEQRFRHRMQQLFDGLAILSYLVALPVSLLATPITSALYGAQFQGVAEILQVQIWALVFVSLNVASGHYLLLEKLNYVILERTFVGAVVNVLLNLVLIPAHGPLGAAWATLISFGTADFFLFRNRTTRSCLWMMMRALIPLRSRMR